MKENTERVREIREHDIMSDGVQLHVMIPFEVAESISPNLQRIFTNSQEWLFSEEVEKEILQFYGQQLVVGSEFMEYGGWDCDGIQEGLPPLCIRFFISLPRNQVVNALKVLEINAPKAFGITFERYMDDNYGMPSLQPLGCKFVSTSGIPSEAQMMKWELERGDAPTLGHYRTGSYDLEEERTPLSAERRDIQKKQIAAFLEMKKRLEAGSCTTSPGVLELLFRGRPRTLIR